MVGWCGEFLGAAENGRGINIRDLQFPKAGQMGFHSPRSNSSVFAALHRVSILRVEKLVDGRHGLLPES